MCKLVDCLRLEHFHRHNLKSLINQLSRPVCHLSQLCLVCPGFGHEDCSNAWFVPEAHTQRAVGLQRLLSAPLRTTDCPLNMAERIIDQQCVPSCLHLHASLPVQICLDQTFSMDVNYFYLRFAGSCAI